MQKRQPFGLSITKGTETTPLKYNVFRREDGKVMHSSIDRQRMERKCTELNKLAASSTEGKP